MVLSDPQGNKASGINHIKMILFRSAIGESRFRAGVGKYIREFQYGSASLEDFLKTMDTTGNHGITE